MEEKDYLRFELECVLLKFVGFLMFYVLVVVAMRCFRFHVMVVYSDFNDLMCK